MYRFIVVDGVHNFRDFGGYETLNGEKVKNNILFRSGQFNNLSNIGLQKLNDIAPKTIVDLRKANERKKQPSNFGDLQINLIENSHKNIDPDTLPPHLEFLRIGERTGKCVEDYMIDITRKLAFEPDHKIVFKEAFKSLAHGKAPIIIHCAAGKDRTGVLCAFILKTLEVSNKDIFEDYLLTNQTPNLDAIIKDYALKISPLIGKEIDSETIRPMGTVNSHFLLAAFEELESRFGNIENYWLHLGIEQDEINSFKNNLINRD